MKKIIDLRSDTVTKPTVGMLDAMMSAQVGDDVWGADPTVNSLEAKAAALFGHKAALYCPSGTMTNQIALQLHCQRLEEVVCHQTAHIYQYETGGYAYNGGIPIKPLPSSSGKLSPDQIKNNINPDYDWLPHTALIAIENTCNRAGGLIYSLDEMQAISKVCSENQIHFHLDGARIFNAIVARQMKPQEIGPLFDTISICMSKGLGAPVGSLLLGGKKQIQMARRLRKVMGGGMRQAGFMAAACIYALDHHVDRLADDHQKADLLASVLMASSFLKDMKPVESNMIIFQVEGYSADEFTELMRANHILCTGMGEGWMRFVTHLDVGMEDIEEACRRIKKI